MGYADHKQQMDYVTAPYPPEVASAPHLDEPKVEVRGVKRSHDSIQEVDGPDDEVAELTQGESKKQKAMNPK